MSEAEFPKVPEDPRLIQCHRPAVRQRGRKFALPNRRTRHSKGAVERDTLEGANGRADAHDTGKCERAR